MKELVVLALVGLIIWCLCSKGRSKTAAFPLSHSHRSGWSKQHVKRHEEGHARVGRALGWKMHVDLDKGLTTPISGPALTAIEWAAIAYGGQTRAGSGGHGEDNRIAEGYLRTLPSSERGAARREAKRIARRYA